MPPKKPPTCVLAVDPGVNALGFAFWRRKPRKPETPCTAGVINCPTSIKKLVANDDFNWNIKADWISRALYDVVTMSCGQHGANMELAIELPEAHLSTAKGMAAMARGNVVQLGYNVGYIAALFQKESPYNTTSYLWNVRKWKGQLKKEVTERRIVRGIGTREDKTGNEIKSHAWDAVGIGLVHCGFPLNEIKWYGK